VIEKYKLLQFRNGEHKKGKLEMNKVLFSAKIILPVLFARQKRLKCVVISNESRKIAPNIT
jgi:hypothetical protein